MQTFADVLQTLRNTRIHAELSTHLPHIDANSFQGV